jgi:hypothetical protein
LKYRVRTHSLHTFATSRLNRGIRVSLSLIADHPDRVEGAAERVLFARQGNLGVTEGDPVDRLPVEVLRKRDVLLCLGRVSFFVLAML